MTESMAGKFELLAPAGELDAAYAAFHYGADAIYLGLPRYSARAEAVNFTPDQLSDVVGYAHSLTPRRKVFVTVNTVILEKEIADVAAMLLDLVDAEVDAVIVQDLGVARVIRRYVPQLRMHASTQLAIHNLEGARQARELGFSRVTLARELTLDEVRQIAAESGLETETFIHGALCYSYSGLCMFSSMMRGRSGNRGRCNYPCREKCRVSLPHRDGLPFSMKDLALTEYAPELRDAGVACFKIEGRKKSPLYVATVVNYYRRLLDGRLPPAEAAELEAQMKTVFSRPWTRAFMRTAKDQDLVDRDTVGHRGVPIGNVEAVLRGRDGLDSIQFGIQRPIERHDGIQVDLPGAERPFGFPVDTLRIIGSGVNKNEGRPVFEAPAGEIVEVGLPEKHPVIPIGTVVYAASSQAVKRSYEFIRPKPGEFKVRKEIFVNLEVTPDGILAAVTVPGYGIEERTSIGGRFEPARDPVKTETAARDAFSKLGDTALRCGSFSCVNNGGLFVPVSKFNELRRMVVAGIETKLSAARELKRQEVTRLVREDRAGAVTAAPGGEDTAAWGLKTDRIANFDLFEVSDWNQVSEAIVDVSRDDYASLTAGLARLAELPGRNRVRLALPMLTRSWSMPDLRERVRSLVAAGWTKWQISNVSGWDLLSGVDGLDLTVDWPLYVLNRQAALAVYERGARAFCCSPEDGRENISALAREFGAGAQVLVYQDTPLFVSASCVNANLGGKCAGRDCSWRTMDLRLARGENVIAVNYGCGTVVIGRQPYSLAGRLAELKNLGVRSLRADFVWRSYEADEVVRLWRRIRIGARDIAGYAGNFDRGLM